MSLAQQHLPQQQFFDASKQHFSQQNTSNKEQQLPFNNPTSQQPPHASMQPGKDQSYKTNPKATQQLNSTQQPDSINKLLRNMTEVSSASNSPSLQKHAHQQAQQQAQLQAQQQAQQTTSKTPSLPPTIPHSSAAVSS